MTLEHAIILSGWIYLAFLGILLATVLLRKRDPATALAWSLTIVFLPVAGPLLFLFTGWNHVSRRLGRHLGHRDEFATSFSLPAPCEDRLRESHAGYKDDRWGAIGEMLERMGGFPRRRGNSFQLYEEGLEAFRSMSQAIEAAEHHVHVLYYILRDDEIGSRLTDLLVRKCHEGVEVRLLVDGIGSWSVSRLAKRIRKAGGQAATFLSPLTIHRATPHLRNHRKIIVCDGHTGFFGGFNIGCEYLGRHRKENAQEWYDLHMRVQGPLAHDLQLIFIEDWDYATDQLINEAAYFPAIPETQPLGETAQMIAGGPDVSPNPIREAILAAFTSARTQIYIATPYLAPDRALQDALCLAAHTGVEVHLITQSWPPDVKLVYFCGQHFIEQLLEAGVHVHSYTPGMMHAKAIGIDGKWAMLGTANLDNRSMYLNFEQMTVLDGPTASRLCSRLTALVELCDEATLESIRQQAWWRRLLTAFARLFAPLL